MRISTAGGIGTKRFDGARRRQPGTRVAEFPGGMLNSVGLANPGLAEVRARDLPWLIGRLRRARIVVNIVGFTETEYADVIAGLEDLEGISAWELNLSCPNTKAGGIEFGADPAAVSRIVSGCRAVTRRALIAKLSPVLPDIPSMAAVAVEAGADGISVVNTIPGSIQRDGLPGLGNGSGGLSGPALLPVGLLAVQKVKARLPHIPVIGVGGVRSADDVRQYLSAGASLVAIGTAQLADPRLPQRIVAELMSHG